MNKPATSTAPTRRRRRWPWVTALVVVVLVVAAFVGSKVYASVESSKAAAPLSTSESSTSSSTASSSTSSSSTSTSTSSSSSLDGTWTVSSGGTAGYRVAEVLNGNDVTVTGRTDQVTGSFTVSGSSLTAGTVTVDLASVATDSTQRDSQFQKIVGVSANPTATFTLTDPVDLSGVTTGSTTSVTLVGTLTINGETKAATVAAEVQRNADGSLSVSGSSPVTWSDFGVEAPSLGFVTVEKAGTIEFLVSATQG